MDEDDFLYSEASAPPQPAFLAKTVDEVISITTDDDVHHIQKQENGLNIKDEALVNEMNEVEEDPEAEADQEEEEEAEEDSEDDVEFIMEATPRSADYRVQRGGRPFQQTRSFSGAPSAPPNQPNQANNLTTEYTPRERSGGSLDAAKQPPSVAQDESLPSASAGTLPLEQTLVDDGPDPSTLPPVKAPPSHPSINPDAPGMLDGRSIFEMDMTNLAEKPWRRPGSDLSDWFNYGFDEISWEAYCYRRREMGELANVLKTNVINFAGMPEEQLLALPPEVRTMVMTGATAMMNAGGPSVAAGMMAPGVGVGMNPMMDMSAMGAMGMGPMGMGMSNEMGMQMPTGGPIMSDVPGVMPGPNMAAIGPGNATPEQAAVAHMNMQDGFNAGGPNPGMMGMNMPGEFNMQQEGNQMSGQQQMYQGMEGGSSTPAPPPIRGGTPVPYRGRGGTRGRGYLGRGRGRGSYSQNDSHVQAAPPAPPPRPASPLPPNVPTGPRNPGNRYKDRDNNVPAVDGLDYGMHAGGIDANGSHTPSNDSDDRGGRKRRLSPTEENGRSSRSSKRR